MEGGTNDLIDRIAQDPLFPLTKEDIVAHLDPKLYVGRSVSQVNEFLSDIVNPVLCRYDGEAIVSELKV